VDAIGLIRQAGKPRRRHQRLGKRILAAATNHTIGDILGSRWIGGLGAGLLLASGLPLFTHKEPAVEFVPARNPNTTRPMQEKEF
jgi:hypothetical protein